MADQGKLRYMARIRRLDRAKKRAQLRKERREARIKEQQQDSAAPPERDLGEVVQDVLRSTKSFMRGW